MWLLGVALTLSAGAAPPAPAAAPDTQPPAGRPRRASFIVIQCDSLGYLDLSCNGQKKFTTPNLDRMAAAGLLFTNFDARGADGPAARAALLLGRDPARANAWLTPDDQTVAQRLKADGYHTGLIGEWNFGGPETGNAPWQKGFDEFAGYLTPEDAENYYAPFMWRYAPLSILNTNTLKFETYVGREGLPANANGKQGMYIPDLYAKAALAFIKSNHPREDNHYQPFFLWLNHPVPRPNQAEAARTGDGLQVPSDAPFSEEAWPRPERNKAAMITRLDADIGRLLDALQTKDLSNNVAVFFTSATLPRKTGGLDPAFFPSVAATNDVRLPMIAWWPLHFPAGRVSTLHWTPGNFLATAAQIAMTEYPTNEVEPSVLRALYGLPLTNAPAKN